MVKQHSRVFKLKVVQEFIGGTSAASLARRFKVHENTIYKWRQQFEASPSDAFRGDTDQSSAHDRITSLEEENAKLAQLLGKTMLEQDFLKGALKHADQYLASLPNKAGTD